MNLGNDVMFGFAAKSYAPIESACERAAGESSLVFDSKELNRVVSRHLYATGYASTTLRSRRFFGAP